MKMKIDFERLRRKLIDDELRTQGIRNEAVLSAMREIPREEFVSPKLLRSAYANIALPIGWGQTISQPWVVAAMAEAADPHPDDNVLDVGTGSGYGAAVLSRMAKEVFTVERIPELAETAAKRLKQMGYDNIRVSQGDGTLGWTEMAPFDVILVGAGGPSVPGALLEQLSVGGRLVMPVGIERGSQKLIRVTRKSSDEFVRDEIGEVRFVPLIGEEGWEADDLDYIDHV